MGLHLALTNWGSKVVAMSYLICNVFKNLKFASSGPLTSQVSHKSPFDVKTLVYTMWMLPHQLELANWGPHHSWLLNPNIIHSGPLTSHHGPDQLVSQVKLTKSAHLTYKLNFHTMYTCGCFLVIWPKPTEDLIKIAHKSLVDCKALHTGLFNWGAKQSWPKVPIWPANFILHSVHMWMLPWHGLSQLRTWSQLALNSQLIWKTLYI